MRTVILLTLLTATILTATEYRYTKIADFFYGTGDSIIINNLGQVAFTAKSRDSIRTAIYISDGVNPPVERFVETDDISDIKVTGFNDGGTVVFTATGSRDDPYDKDIYIFPGTSGPALVARETKEFSFDEDFRPAINNQGTVAWIANGNVYLRTGAGPVQLVVDSSDRFQGIGYSPVSAVSINSSNTIAFVWNNVNTQSRNGIYTQRQGAIPLLEVSPANSPNPPALNDSGAVLWANSIGVWISRQGKSVRLVAEGEGRVDGRWLGINNLDQYVYGRVDSDELISSLGAASGIYSGPDRVRDKVIAAGDSLFGSHVRGLRMGPGRRLNNQGQVLFHYVLDNTNIEGIAIATPTDGSGGGNGGGGGTTSNPNKTTGNPSCQQGGACGGDPISIGTGNMYDQVTDYETTGANKLSFTRYYNALASTPTLSNMVGSHWRTNYDRFLQINSATSVTAERPDGRQVNYTLAGGTWSTDSDVDLKLSTLAGGWILTDGNDTVETYTNFGTTLAAATTIQARNGYRQQLLYSSTGDLLSVSDSFNRVLSFAYTNGLLQSLTTPDGLVIGYSYSSSGVTAGTLDRLKSVTYSTSPQTSQTYSYTDSRFPFALTQVTDENGNAFSVWTYDAQGRALSSEHAGGTQKLSIAYGDADGSRTTTNELGQQTVYRFTTLQDVPKITQMDRLATSTTAAATQKFTYDANGYKASETDWNGNLTSYVNDTRGQPTTIVEASGTPLARTTTITYQPTLHLPSSLVTPGLTVTFTYDSTGNPLTRTETDSTTSSIPYSTQGTTRKWTYTWSNGLLTSVQGPRTDVTDLTKFTYDSTGTLVSATDALGHKVSITQHSPGGLPQTMVDVNGVTTNLTYDKRLRLVSRSLVTANGPLTTSYTYDAAGNLLTTKAPDGAMLTNTYDAAHRLTRTTDLFNQSIRMTLDLMGHPTASNIFDNNGNLGRAAFGSYDALGRRLTDTGGVGQKSGYTYDANGNALTITDPLGRVTRQTFDGLNRRVRITDAAGGITSLTYDAHDRPLTVTDPNGGVTTYTYNGFGDLIQRVSPDTGTTVYRYDPSSNLVQMVDARGAVANYTYDALNRVTSISYPASASENVKFTYDEPGYGFSIGRLTTVVDPAGTLHRTYDERGNVLNETRSR